MPNTIFTDQDLRAYIIKGAELAQKFERAMKAEPDGSLTMGTVLHACAMMFSDRAKTSAEAEQLARDLAAAVVSTYAMKESAR